MNHKNNKLNRGVSLKDGKKHQQDHETWTRRNFLSTIGIGGSMSLLFSQIPIIGMAASPLHAALAASETDRILILIRLAGGNDGLNTVVPLCDYDNYLNYRPSVALPESDILPLSGQNDFGLNPVMQDAQTMWNDGNMKIIHGVGYHNMSLSHFTGSDIWATARTENSADRTGFIGGVMDACYPNYLVNLPDVPPAIHIGQGEDTILQGRDTIMGVSINDVEQFYNLAQTGQLHNTDFEPNCYYEEQLQFARSIANGTFRYSGVINDAYQAGSNAVQYTDAGGYDSIKKELSIVARLIKGNLGTKVYMVSLGGFDTHGNQNGKHDDLLRHLSENVALFFQDLAGTGYEDKVIAMTISEFGRRIYDTSYGGAVNVTEAGTDHGEAAPMMLFGSALKGNGLIGTCPDLVGMENHNGNLQYTTDFRSVYATVLQNWLCIEPHVVDEVLGGSFSRIDELLAPCMILPVELAYFVGTPFDRCKVRLRWKTLTETNTDKFQIEKSHDAINFETIGEVPANGNSIEPIGYRFEYNDATDNNYYRLKIIDNDGSVEYSDVISVSTNCLFNDIEIFPNPLIGGNLVNINVNVNQPVTMETEIINIMGRVVIQKTFDLQAGNNLIHIPVEQLPEGKYSIRFKGNGEMPPSQKFIKIK